jgi:A/G-specific adenine glycosylase
MTGTIAARRLPSQLQDAILAWYDATGRSLPFRGTSDPYLVLVSEVMAQQTQVSRVGPAWTTFATAFPTVAALAAASPADVVRAWRGLGYNRRALNLWRAAGVIVAEHDGRVPADVAALQRLPGVGPYTARAVAAIAFGAAVGAVDTNVRRVLGRAVTGSSDVPAAVLQGIADASVPARRTADWTHALMDVGAAFCRPSAPRCDDCPARRSCRFARAAVRGHVAAERLPLRPPSRSIGEPFESSSRWLRGRIIDRLRDAEPTAWTPFVASIGSHPTTVVGDALAGLAREGLVELHPTDATLARLPSA